MFQIVNGSKEQVAVDIIDLSEAVTDLSAYLPKFSVKTGAGVAVVTLAAATATGMRILCMIDTVAVVYALGIHKLYVSFTVGSEVPLIYVTDFHII